MSVDAHVFDCERSASIINFETTNDPSRYHSQTNTSAAQMSMADDAPPAMPRSEPFGMMHEHEPDPTYAASNHDARHAEKNCEP